jgi:hypothetical protein
LETSEVSTLRIASAFRELYAAAGAVQAVFLPLFHAAVTGQEAGIAERFVAFRINGFEGPGNAQLAGIGLAGWPAPVDVNRNVELLAPANLFQRGQHCATLLIAREVLFQGTLVDFDLALAGANSHTGNRGLAPTGAKRLGACDLR